MIAKLAPYGTLIVFWAGIFAAFAGVLGATGAYLQSMHNRALNSELRTKSAELLDLQNGLVAYTKGLGSYFYLDVGPVGGANFALMTLKRVGKNPVYEAKINMVDSQRPGRPQPKLIDVGTLGSDAITGAWQLNMDYGDVRHLTVFLTSRNAEHRQDIRLRRVGGQIVAATRVVDTYDDSKVIHEKVDAAFPRDEQGRVDWNN